MPATERPGGPDAAGLAATGQGSPAPTIIPATPGDVGFVRRLSHAVFGRFGDYRRILPPMMGWPGIATVVATDGGRRIGFAMYALDREPGEVDLIAIAIAPTWQRRGVGRALLQFVESQARIMSPGEATSVRLTVAEDNAAARGLFERAGYVRIPGDRGTYDGGQASLGMRKRLG